MDKLVNEMKNNGDDIKEKEIMEKVLRTLSTRFDYIVAAIEEAKDLNTMTLNDLQASLESREMQMNERSSGTVEQALKAQTNVRNEGLVQRRANYHHRGQNFKGRWRNSQLDSNQATRGRAWRATKPLELVHSNLCYVEVPSNGGYSEDTKAYKLYNPETQKVIISRDITFDEDEAWDWSEKEKALFPVPVTIHREVEDTTEEPSAESTPDSPPQRYPQRERRPPPHLQDYEVGRDDDPKDTEEEVTYYALFTDCDPLGKESGGPREDISIISSKDTKLNISVLTFRIA
ncbi:hypothetical protein RJT34_31819 [Clitoria ternatea]|uniref:Retroviral polymerase SH3-like domain-containing protein n=1 Tax=Clitoria ternatea TaxID=43366 RepID=A0AAN9EW78_CLITE